MIYHTAIFNANYQRSWARVKDVIPLPKRVYQAGALVDQHAGIKEPGQQQQLWLEYLYTYIINQFQDDVWTEARQSARWRDGGDLLEDFARAHDGEAPPFCLDALAPGFRTLDLHGKPAPAGVPHLLTGYRSSIRGPEDLFEALFGSEDHHLVKSRRHWKDKPFRKATRDTVDLVCSVLGERARQAWWEGLRTLVLATHWILPYPGELTLIEKTKRNNRTGQRRRLIWVSIINETALIRQARQQGFRVEELAEHKIIHARAPEGPEQNISLRSLRSCFGQGNPNVNDGAVVPAQLTPDEILNIARAEGIVFAFGRAKDGTHLFPVVELGLPPKLRLSDHIRNRSQHETKSLMHDVLEGRMPETLLQAQGGRDEPAQRVPAAEPQDNEGPRRSRRHVRVKAQYAPTPRPSGEGDSGPSDSSGSASG
jgi:hypothetical protein